MISENQIREMLELCESRIGRPLKRLREALRVEDPVPGIWELLLLYAALQTEKAVHEPDEATPDIQIGTPGDCLWIEATTVSHRDEKSVEKLSRFVDRIHSELRMKFGAAQQSYSVEYDCLDPSRECNPPEENQFNSLFKLASWKEFLTAVASGDLSVTWELQDQNLRFMLRSCKMQHGYSSSGGPVLFLPAHPAEHPVYRAIRKKAKQAREWTKRHQSEEKFQPLVVWIAAVGDLSQIDPDAGHNKVTLRQAVLGALCDPSEMSVLEQYNSVGTWWDPPQQPVSGARRIALVCVTVFEQRQDGYGGPLRLYPKTTFYRGTQAGRLPDSVKARIRNVNKALSCVQYGPGWEAWNHKHDKTVTPAKDRARYAGGVISYSKGSDVMKIKIPAELLTRVLSGEESANSIWSSYSGDTGAFFKEALDEGRKIINTSFIDRQAGSRDEPSVEIQFGPPTEPLIRKLKSN
ncbi:MAG: hypothetical protein JKY43_08280 [Phycisphaerales bacterium]|nr:hypothetical protein [Phycisphaerales bacterium]